MHGVAQFYQVSDEVAGDIFPGCSRQLVLSLMPVDNVERVVVYNGVQTWLKLLFSHRLDGVIVQDSDCTEYLQHHTFMTVKANSSQRWEVERIEIDLLLAIASRASSH